MTEPAHIRTVIEDPASGVHACYFVINDRDLCFLHRNHNGGHLPMPVRWPSMDITRENPRFQWGAA